MAAVKNLYSEIIEKYKWTYGKNEIITSTFINWKERENNFQLLKRRKCKQLLDSGDSFLSFTFSL